jgi:hypothetical protein
MRSGKAQLGLGDAGDSENQGVSDRTRRRMVLYGRSLRSDATPLSALLQGRALGAL